MTGSEKGPLPYYRWYVKDYRSSRRVQRMHFLARGLYRELLDECWEEGAVPDDVEALAEICGCPPDVMAQHWPDIRRGFQPQEPGSDWLISARLERERTVRDKERVVRAHAGRAGGLAKSRNEQVLLDLVASSSTSQKVPYSSSTSRSRSKSRSRRKDTASAAVAASEAVAASVPSAQGEPAAEPQSASVASQSGNGGQPHAITAPVRGKPGTAVARTPADMLARLSHVFAEISNGSAERMTKERERALAAEMVFLYWQAKYGKQRTRPDRKRLARIEARLKENENDVSELLYALDGGHADDYLMARGAHSDHRAYDGIETLLRDRSQVERLAGTRKKFLAGLPHHLLDRLKTMVAEEGSNGAPVAAPPAEHEEPPNGEGAT